MGIYRISTMLMIRKSLDTGLILCQIWVGDEEIPTEKPAVYPGILQELEPWKKNAKPLASKSISS